MDEIDEAFVLAQRIDAFFDAAARDAFGAHDEEQRKLYAEMDRFTPFKVIDFANIYQSSGIYPIERLPELVKRFADVRLPLEYFEFNAALANEHYYWPINKNPQLADSPRLRLNLMAIDNAIIGHSRTAWEKLMRAVYFLESGDDLTPSGKRSYKAKFFEWVATQPKWLFLEPYDRVVIEHDTRYRTGEYHKGSILRPRMLGIETPGVNDFGRLANYMRNGIWPNILEIVAGRWPISFTDLHAPEDDEHGIDPRYLPPA